jgi:hypothetical protein
MTKMILSLAMPETLEALNPPPNNPVIGTSFDGDDIQKLGDEIAGMSIWQRKQLAHYLISKVGDAFFTLSEMQ